IFHKLPIESFDPPFTEQFRTPHGLDFEPTGDLYDLDYERVADGEAFAAADEHAVARSGTDSIEAAVRLAEATGARVHGEILACEVNFPGDHDQWISYIPPDEGIASYLMNTDTIAFVGCSTNTTLVSHDDRLVPKDATCIHIGDDAWELGKNQPADAAVVGDPGLVMDQVADIVEDRLSDEKLEERLDFTRQMKEMTEQQMTSLGESDVEDDPRASKAELVDTMRDTAGDAYIVDESITSKYALLTRWPLDPEQAISNKGGGLGYGLPAAVGAGLAERQTDSPRDVIGFIGDGSYLYYPHTLYTAARYDVDLTVVIPDNRNYRILKDNTLEMFGGSEGDYDFIGMDIDPPVDIPKNAESHGARGRLVEKPDEIAESIERALDETGPTVLDVLVHD
ncbi:MAG: thiamine pyrophosphate-dependent enzyme, partial [Halobacteria archaeon]|nr:thiamine pyrophosphate-dependent enzyme [Halobacteria archaeon]